MGDSNENALPMALMKEVNYLNQRFIGLMVAAAEQGKIDLEPELQRSLGTIPARRHPPVPVAPFLLYRVSHEANESLPGCLDGFNDAVAELTTLSLSFLWHLSREDLLAAQMVSGAGARWCQQLARLSIVDLVGLTAGASLQARLIDVPGYWQDLARRRGISALQRASLGAAGLQLILSRSRRKRVEGALTLPATSSSSEDARLI
ncbi:MAG: hypothetical protein AB8F65_07885 [Woeseiaceae bacterium]